MRGTDQMEEKKHAEHVRHEFSIMFKHYRMFHHVVPNVVPNDYQELEAKEIIRTIFIRRIWIERLIACLELLKLMK